MAVQDDSSVALIPSAYGTSKVYSVIPSNGNGDFTFSRSGNATRVNKGGYIETMGSNVPRLDYPLIDGVVQDCPALLLEPQRTNFGRYSEQISSWSQARVSTSDNQTISPDGSQNASKTTVTATTGPHPVYITQTSTVTSGSNYVMSVFVKKSTTNYIRFTEGYSNYGLIFNFDTEEITENGNASSSDIGVEKYPNDWYRLSVKFVGSSSTNYQIGIYIRNNSNSESFTGTDEAAFIWGHQMEEGTYHSSYVKNASTGSTTRSADVCNGSGTSAEFNDSEGVLFAEIAALANDGTKRRIAISNGGTSNRIVLGYFTDNSIQSFGSVTTSQFNLFDTSTNINLFNKCAIKYKQNDFALWVNGFEIDTDTSGSVPTGLSELAFDDGAAADDFYGKTKQLMTFKTALTDSELETLTSWDSFNAMAKGQLYSIE